MKRFIPVLRNSLGQTLAKQKEFWQSPRMISSTLLGVAMLVASLVINYSAGLYTNSRASNSVQDILLDNLPVYKTGFVFIYGALAMWLFVALILITNPKNLPFTLKSVALLIVIRSIFTTMTHLGPYPGMTSWPQSDLLSKFTFGADFFFSGHTAFPFLFALIYWHKIFLRWFFLLSSVIFAASVLLGHLHYSIDVFAAFFITYSVFILGCRFFTEEYEIMYNNKPIFTIGINK